MGFLDFLDLRIDTRIASNTHNKMKKLVNNVCVDKLTPISFRKNMCELNAFIAFMLACRVLSVNVLFLEH